MASNKSIAPRNSPSAKSYAGNRRPKPVSSTRCALSTWSQNSGSTIIGLPWWNASVTVLLPPGANERPALATIVEKLDPFVLVVEGREPVEVAGPGVLAFDGDRERSLAPGQRARLWVTRDGPRRIDVAAALERAAAEGLFLDRGPGHDALDGAAGVDCC